MNQLTVKVTDVNGKSFELLVDGVPLSELLDDGRDGIPYWIVEDDLPYLPPNREPAAGSPKPKFRLSTKMILSAESELQAVLTIESAF